MGAGRVGKNKQKCAKAEEYKSMGVLCFLKLFKLVKIRVYMTHGDELLNELFLGSQCFLVLGASSV